MGAEPHLADQADFDGSMHDDTIYGLRLDTADPERGLWRADLVLDIDHIVEWVCRPDRPHFRVAPATLTFHDVTDLVLAIDWGNSGHQVAPQTMTVDHLEREVVEHQKICLDRPYYRWTIALNGPKGGKIAFGASTCTLTLRASPIFTDEQQLSPLSRGASARVDATD
jgi:hypothetical protein